MTYLFSFTIAGIAARLKTSVTGLLQGSLQGLRALARLGDVSYPEDPPLALRPLRVNTAGRPSAVRCVLACSLLLCLCLLSVFALPMETAAHKKHLHLPPSQDTWNTKRWKRTLDEIAIDDQPLVVYPPPWDNPYEAINWVRVYKNPKITPAADLTEQLTGGRRQFARWPLWQVPNVETGPSYLLPSLHWEETEPMWNPDNAIWVDFVSADDGGALIDTGENSGLVTATENTTVKPGDRVAIAVNFTTWGGPSQT